MNKLLKRSKKNLKKFIERCVQSSEKSGFVSRSSLNFFPFLFYPLYLASRGFSLAWLLAFTKSFKRETSARRVMHFDCSCCCEDLVHFHNYEVLTILPGVVKRQETTLDVLPYNLTYTLGIVTLFYKLCLFMQGLRSSF